MLIVYVECLAKAGSYPQQRKPEPLDAPLAAARRRLARNRLAIHLDGAQVNVPADAMAAAGHQVHEPYFIHFAQVGIVDPNLIRGAIHAKRDRSIRIQLDPAHVRQCELSYVEHGDGRVRVVSHEQSSIRELYNGPHLVKSGGLDHPAYSAQPGEVHIIILRPESDGEGPRAGTRPHRERRAFASRRSGGEQFLGGGSVLFEFNIWIGDIFLNDRNLAVLAGRPHPFDFEDWGRIGRARTLTALRGWSLHSSPLSSLGLLRE